MVNMHYEDEQEEDRGDMTKNRSDTENSGRKSIGRRRKGASFPAPAAKDELAAAYASLLSQVQERIRSERLRVVSAANEALVLLYWDIGQAILYRQEQEGWGAKVIDRLSHDLWKVFPDLRGFSPRNLKYMRSFASVWPERAIVQQVVAQIPWGQNVVLMDKLADRQVRLWYAERTRQEGWSRSVLLTQIEAELSGRESGKAKRERDDWPKRRGQWRHTKGKG